MRADAHQHFWLVYGSDRPIVEPAKTGWEASLQTNAAALLAPVRTTA